MSGKLLFVATYQDLKVSGECVGECKVSASFQNGHMSLDAPLSELFLIDGIVYKVPCLLEPSKYLHHLYKYVLEVTPLWGLHTDRPVHAYHVPYRCLGGPIMKGAKRKSKIY